MELIRLHYFVDFQLCFVFLKSIRRLFFNYDLTIKHGKMKVLLTMKAV